MVEFFTSLNTIQPISDDYSTDGTLDEAARIDHQHGLSPTLRAAIVGRVADIASLPSAIIHANEIWRTLDDKIMYSDGVGWIILYEPRQVYLPTTNVVVGNGTIHGKYQRYNGRCKTHIEYVLGSTSTMGDASFSLPIATLIPAGFNLSEHDTSGVATLYDATGPRTFGRIFYNTSTTVRCLYHAVTGPMVVGGLLSGVLPFIWTTNDMVQIVLDFEMATPYL